MRHRLIPLLAVLAALACALPATARAQDTTAVAVNTKDDSTLVRLAFQIRRTMQSVVDESNAAVAVGSCSECRTVAIAFQVVLAMGDVEQLTPTNLALAYNLDCTFCDTAAFAYQLVTGTGGPVHFSAEGNRRLAELRRRLLGLRGADLSDDELAAQLGQIADELRQILAHDVVDAGPPDASGAPSSGAEGHEPTATPDNRGEAAPGEDQAGGAGATATPAPTPDASSTTAPPSDATPDPSSTPAPDATPAASATPPPGSDATPDAQPSPTPTADASSTPDGTPTPTPSAMP